MSTFKFTGTNIAAALLILGYFFPWAGALTLSMSGFSITSNGISPGMLAAVITGLPRIFMILAILVPLSGAVILYQNMSGNKKFEQFFKPAHFIPAVYLLIGLNGLYFKMKPDLPADGEMLGRFSRRMSEMAPGAFDILSFGFYLSLASGIYLLLVGMGKVKDKEYYKPAPTTNTNNNDNPGPQQ